MSIDFIPVFFGSYVKGVQCIPNGFLFYKNGRLKGKGLVLGAELPVQNVVDYPPPPRTVADNLHVLLSTVFYNCTGFRIFKGMEFTDSFGQF